MIRQAAVLAVAAICLSGLTTAKSVDVSNLQGYSNSLLLSLYPYGEIDQTLLEYSKKFDYEKFLESYTEKEVLTAFWRIYQHGLLPHDQVFSIFNDDHRDQAITLFKALYYAPTIESFTQLAAWARVNVNKEMFVYAYSIAVLHRTDTLHLPLPDPTQIFPNYFFNSDFITAYADRAVAIYKGHGDADHIREPISAKYTSAYAKNTRDPENSLAYFFEDVGINSCYYYMHLMTPFWMSSSEFPITKHRAELYRFTHRWIVTRYKMERYSIGLGPMEHIDWNKPIQTGYTPMMIHSNGQLFPQREESSYVPATRSDDVEAMIDFENRVKEALDSGYIVDKQGGLVPIAGTFEGFLKMTNIIEGNADSLNYNLYGSIDKLGRSILGFSSKGDSALEGFSASLRDPVFYRFYDKIVKYSEKLLKHVEPRKVEALTNTHLSIKSFAVDDVITYLETYDTLVSNTPKPDGSSYVIKARQTRLNHKNFGYQFIVKSDKIFTARVRIFLGPKFHTLDKPTYKDFRDFYLVDYFAHDMVVGENKFTRNSRESPIGIADSDDYPWSENVNKTTNLGLIWPQRLLFPKGTPEGLPVYFYVYITESIPTQSDSNPTVDTPWKKFDLDTKTLDHPIDRSMESHDLPNAALSSARIYYKDESQLNLTV